MEVRCINNEGSTLRVFEYQLIDNKESFGRFGSSANTRYEVEIGNKYLVMGIIVFKTYQAYLIDDKGLISAVPCQLFDVQHNNIPANWHFRLVGKDENIYPFVQAIFGYPELCSDINAYENLLVEKETLAERIYFKRKLEFGTKPYNI